MRAHTALRTVGFETFNLHPLASAAGPPEQS